jgi:ADP-ribose pyrophosphatase YjhB (NUDIX family)
METSSSEDVIGAGARWIPEPEYRRILERVPILCVDVLLLDATATGRIGLISRATPDGYGWCLVGGAALRDEPLAHAVERHVAATLGPEVRIIPDTLVLGAVAQYFTRPGIGALVDPRKHAVALTFSASITGEPRPLGEAVEFCWFDAGDPGAINFGFGQGEVVRSLLHAARTGVVQLL